MSDWYYANPNAQRQGPLPAETLRELFQSGRINLDTLVWRDGMPQWRPLSEFAGELGLLELTSAPCRRPCRQPPRHHPHIRHMLHARPPHRPNPACPAA